MAEHKLRGLYAITPDEQNTRKLVCMVRACLMGGASCIQYRNTAASVARRRIQAEEIAKLCKKHHVPLIINDDIQLVFDVEADGLHIGKDNTAPSAMRMVLGSDKLLGITCYSNFARAEEAKIIGADYIVFGCVFPSKTKPKSSIAPLSLFKRARSLKLPKVAIGGITVQNAKPVIEAGADMVSVIAGLFQSPDIYQTARQFTELFSCKNFE